MSELEFNKKCAEYMGYTVHCEALKGCSHVYVDMPSDSLTFYNPHDDLNQMAEVVEKIREKTDGSIGREYGQIVVDLINEKPIKQALRDFITECMKPLEGGDRE